MPIIMFCKNCGKEIMEDAFGWIHTETARYRCERTPQPDPQQYAEPAQEGENAPPSR